jgi:nucleotide-binding universal stress UspA family protein
MIGSVSGGSHGRGDPRVHCRQTEETTLKTVLYATDFSPTAAPALPYALSIAKEHQAELVLLYVAQKKDVPFSFDRSIASREMLEALHKLVPDSAGLESPPRCLVDFGKPCKVIIEQAKDLKAGLIVVGARQADAFAAVISHSVGGTAYRVAANAECPVLTIPQI